MSGTRTQEQIAAIGSRGRVIVSASAGSGKTTVMIDRLVSLILGGADVRKILAVTFTNKAAAQMREKLRLSLIKRAAEADEGERKRLKEQLAALPLADISTIHSFCARLVRTYFYLSDLDPAFEIISPDDPQGCRLSGRALDEVFETCYASGDEDFHRLLAVYFHKKKDAKLKRIVLSLHAAIRGRADYRELLEGAGRADRFDEVCAYLWEDLRTRSEFFAEGAEDLGVFFAENSGRGLDVCAAVADAARRIAEQKDLFGMAEEAGRGLTIPRMPPSSKFSGEALVRYQRLKGLSAGIKELYKELLSYAPRGEEAARYQNGARLSGALAKLVLRFDEAYSRLKREAGVLDYDDLEHFAIRTLSDPDALSAVRQKYDYVFVDEYQDVNPAQEKILSLVGEKEIFLVGDAKQSIYGFRGSRSEFFLQKEREFPNALSLSENFRSSAAVLDAVNRVFSYAMTKESCGIDYRLCRMRGGARYGEHEGAVSFRFVPKNEREKCERGVYSVLKEASPPTDGQAEAIADLIAEEVGSEFYDADSGLMKKVGWGDIAVLARKRSGDAEKIVAALSARNIPVTALSSVNVCEFWEARLLIDWLSYLDDPEQDIPLAGALLSRIGGFSETELWKIRQRAPDDYAFRTACKKYRETCSDTIALKLQTFAQKTARYRALQCVRTAEEMGDLLLSEGLEAEIAAKRDGAARLKRVRRLLREGDGTVNEFLQKLKAASYNIEYSESGGEDAVKVLTMHAAKGLEYPVVILAGMNKPFHGADSGEVLCTEKFGFAPKSCDPERRLFEETVLRRASGVYQRREEIKEELNLFYVAMTRAKYRLYLFFESAEQALSPMQANCFADFIDFGAFGKEISPPLPLSKEPLARSALFVPLPEEKQALTRTILSAFRAPYPFAESCALPVKSSATELMHGEEGEREVFPRERLVGEAGALPEEGSAYHAFLQYVEFGKNVKEELFRMEKAGLLSKEQIALLKEEELEKILRLPALAALAGKRIFREQRFLLKVPAREILSVDADDEILLQGAIDLLCEDEEGFLILDYKYSSRGAEELRAAYGKQIAIYRKAVSKALRVEERTVRAKIVNIKRLFETEM